MKAVLVVPKKILFDPKAMFRIVETTMDMVAEDTLIDFETTVQTWKKKPEFVITKPRPGERAVWTSNNIYRWISRGTRVRYAHMTKGFRAKTIVNQLRSRIGRGKLAYISKAKPLPGIQARNYEAVVVKKWNKQFGILMQRAVNTEIARQISQNQGPP